jgi:hypothetical protein
VAISGNYSTFAAKFGEKMLLLSNISDKIMCEELFFSVPVMMTGNHHEVKLRKM